MVDGQYKIGAIIQARLGSTRLPNKVLLPLPVGNKENKTVLSWIVQSLNESKLIDETVIATSRSKINDALEEYSRIKLKKECFRGSENDVLSRFYEIAVSNNYDLILRFTADNPVIDPKYLDKFINYFLDNNLDYLGSKNLPLGSNFSMMKTSELIKAYKTTNSLYDKEHVTPFIKENAKKIEWIDFKDFKGNTNYRFTIDYPSDFAAMNIIFTDLKEIDIDDICLYVKNNHWITEINESNYQKKEYEDLACEIEELIPILDKYEFKRVKKILKS